MWISGFHSIGVFITKIQKFLKIVSACGAKKCRFHQFSPLFFLSGTLCGKISQFGATVTPPPHEAGVKGGRTFPHSRSRGRKQLLPRSPRTFAKKGWKGYFRGKKVTATENYLILECLAPSPPLKTGAPALAPPPPKFHPCNWTPFKSFKNHYWKLKENLRVEILKFYSLFRPSHRPII